MIRYVLIFAVTLLVGACGSTPDENRTSPLLPMPRTNDPSDAILKSAIAQALRKNKAPASSGYLLKRYDLNGDGRREGLVFLRTPYGYWCNIYGCTMLVFRAHDKEFTLMGHIQPVREPVYITHTKTNGWKDLVVRVSGRESRAKNVILRHNGRGYPENPDRLPAAAYQRGYSDIRLFYD